MSAFSVREAVAERSPEFTDRIRRASVAAGRLSAGVRMVPDFLVVGAQRSGTTTLYRLLADHPALVRPAFHKGIGFFDLNYEQGWDWYQGHFPIRIAAKRRTRSLGPPMTFDSSGYYLFHPLAPERIARHLPQVRIIALVRDPVERAISAHAHELARGFETEPFEAAVRLEVERLAGEEERLLADPTYLSFAHRHWGYLARGRYAEQLHRYERHIDRERIKVVDANAFFLDPQAQFSALQEWLGLPQWSPDTVGVHNARSRSHLDPDLVSGLRDVFAPWDEQLEPYLGGPPSWRS